MLMDVLLFFSDEGFSFFKYKAVQGTAGTKEPDFNHLTVETDL